MKQNTSLFSRLLLWQKFSILGVLALILVSIPFGLYWIETQKNIETAVLETKGIPPTVAVLRLVQLTQRHRGLSSIFLSGDDSVINMREMNEKELADAITAIDNMIKRDVNDLAFNKKWGNIVQTWQTIKQQVIDKKIGRPQSITLHSALINEQLRMLDAISDHFSLSLEADLGRYSLIRSVLYGIPEFTEALGKLRATGGGVLTAKEITLEEKLKISLLIEAAEVFFKDNVLSNIDKTFEVRPDIKTKLDGFVQDATRTYKTAIDLTRKEILDSPQLTYSATEYFDIYTTVIDNQFDLNKKALIVLNDELSQQVTNLRNKQLSLSLGLLALLALSSIMAYFISRSITKPMSNLVEVMQKLASGDSSVRANLETFDEIGLLGRQFDMMVDQRELVNANIQRENEVLNASIIDLLQAVAKLAQKDLTTKVPVSENVTGLIADALNLLADETSKVLNRVVQLSVDVAHTSQQVKEQADKTISVALEDNREVEQSAKDLNAASEEMFDVVKLTTVCNEAAQKAIRNTDKAQETVLDTVQGITTIRDTIRETEKRIKRLGERSQEIGGVVSLINNIAERTHILALNASMHAASAGEAGRGFAVVANEVQRLAENSREATSKIAALVNNIQVETADTVITMNEAIGQVVKGTDLAQQAGNEMRQTRETTADLVLLVQRIADSANAQAQTTQKLRDKARQIQKTTEQTCQQLQAQGVQTEHLVDLSNDLVESISVFTLPKIV
ncbi:MAG: methyl-accepting chemotaxis protein [Methylococcaceae bacterium]